MHIEFSIYLSKGENMNDLYNETKQTINKENNKIKVASAEIVVHGTIEKPYYEIKYLVIGEDEYRIGYSSYDINNVFGWLEECFEIVGDSKTV